LDAKPFYSKAYAVPYAHLKVFKEELNPLVAIGVLSHTGASEWAAGAFIIPKKDNRVRIKQFYARSIPCHVFKTFSIEVVVISSLRSIPSF
jgi:hypothetical protein